MALVARVARGAPVAFVFFFAAPRSALFSLSSAEISSLLRFSVRAEVLGATFGAAFVVVVFVVAFVVPVVAVAARTRFVLGAAAGAADGAGARTGTATGGITTVTASGSSVLTGDACLGGGGSRMSIILVVRLLLGTRFTRRSRRDLRLAHCASHMARSFSLRAETDIKSDECHVMRRYSKAPSSSRFARMAAFVSADMGIAIVVLMF